MIRTSVQNIVLGVMKSNFNIINNHLDIDCIL